MAAAPGNDLVATFTRTLLASGYVITNAARQPRHIEIHCERRTAIGAQVRFLVAITDQAGFAPTELQDLRDAAKRQTRSLALVASESAPDHLSHQEFLDALGGPIPSWRALSADYTQLLKTAAANQLPNGLSGEAWQVFEDLAADGFEFVFGRRVRRMGGRKRGLAVSDMLAMLPDAALLVMDAKAAAAGFDVNTDTLRALGEYVRLQQQRQRGYNEVFAAVLVSSTFRQQRVRLNDLSKTFYADWGVPLSMMPAEVLAQVIERVIVHPGIRNAVRWRQVFAGGAVEWSAAEAEIRRATQERYGSDA